MSAGNDGSIDREVEPRCASNDQRGNFTSKKQTLREAAQALADRMPKGSHALNSFHAREEVLALRAALSGNSSAFETSLDERIAHLGSDLAEAVAKDEAPEEGGFDLSAGMFGRHVSAWIRKLAGSPEETKCEFEAEHKDRAAEGARYCDWCGSAVNGPAESGKL